MYCHNCGYDLSKAKIDKTNKVYDASGKTGGENAYVCPRCGEIIHSHLSEDEVKHLSQAAHSEVHRAHNFKNTGKCAIVIGGILLAIALIFFLLSFKISNGRQLDPGCIEFYVFCVLTAIAAFGLIYGGVNLYIGINKDKKYNKLLKAIQNEVFVQ